jgi:hypothetical protein
MDHHTTDQLLHLYHTNRMEFDRIAQRSRVEDPEYYAGTVQPLLDRLNKKGKSKHKGLVVFSLIGLVVFIFLMIKGLDSGKTTAENYKEVAAVDEKVYTKYEIGIEYFNLGKWTEAVSYLNRVGKSDSNYAEATKKLNIARDEIKKEEAEQKKKELKKSAIEKRYKKLCKSGLYEYEIEQKLSGYGFYQDYSGFDTAPDGSTGIKRIYTKHEEGYKVIFTLQGAYALGHYYCDVVVK